MGEKQEDVDIVDVVSLGASVIGTAALWSSTGTLAWGFLAWLGYWGQRKFRRSETARRWADRLSEYPQLETIAPTLLPGPNETETALTIRQDKPLDVRVVGGSGGNELIDVDAYENLPWHKRVTMPAPGIAASAAQPRDVFSGTARSGRRSATMMDQQTAYLLRSLKRLPKYISYTQLPEPASPLAVPIGIESAQGYLVWGDFSANGNLIHALIAGQTGAGKDALLRLWFTMLTTHNTPQDLQFVVIDGKIDWLSPALAESSFMAIPPAGGIEIVKEGKKRVNIAEQAMASNLDWVFDEIKRRDGEMKRYGAVDLVSYRKRSGKQLPYIFVIASDVGNTFNDDLEMLIKLLIARGRSYGIRLIISMQNPVGEDTKWRSQIGLVMCGYQQNPDHDRYIMGMNVDRLLVRPSQLPNPEEDDRSKGLFVVRHGNTQCLVRTAHLPEDDWFQYIEQILPKKKDADDMLLNQLLTARQQQTQQVTQTQPVYDDGDDEAREEHAPITPVQPILTRQQIEKIQQLVINNATKSEIMREFGWTNSVTYAKKSKAVDIIIAATKRRIEQRYLSRDRSW